MAVELRTRASTPDVRRRELVALAGACVERAGGLPGTWVFTDPADPGRQVAIEIDDRARAVGITTFDSAAALGDWTKVTCAALVWVLGRSRPDFGPVSFSWRELSMAIGDDRPSAAVTDGLRRAVALLAHPVIRWEAVDLRRDGPAGWPVVTTGGVLEPVGASAIGRPGRHAPSVKPALVRPASGLLPQFRAGSWWSVPLEGLLDSRSDLVRRLWIYATVATLAPAGADGIIRVPLQASGLLAALGVRDRRSDRARRRLTEAVDEVVARDSRFRGSDGRRSDGHVLLVRSQPLLPRREREG